MQIYGKVRKLKKVHRKTHEPYMIRCSYLPLSYLLSQACLISGPDLGFILDVEFLVYLWLLGELIRNVIEIIRCLQYKRELQQCWQMVDL